MFGVLLYPIETPLFLYCELFLFTEHLPPNKMMEKDELVLEAATHLTFSQRTLGRLQLIYSPLDRDGQINGRIIYPIFHRIVELHCCRSDREKEYGRE